MKRAEVVELFTRLREINPHPVTELAYSTPYELLVAVVLSAQATDVGVNKATRRLYPVANTARAIVDLGVDGLKRYISSIGLFNTKAKNVIALSRLLVEQHGGQVPDTRAALEALAPLRALQRRIVIIGTVGLLGALLIGVGLAGGIIAPLQGLVAGMREVLRGNLQYRSRIERHDELGFIAKSFNEMVDGLEERELIRDTFGRFVSHDVAEAVLTGRVPLQGERRDVSILFQDIRGFTSLSERLDPAVLLRLLNQFFTEVVAAVEAEGGVVKQFLGDGVMALFGAPQPYPDHPERAVRAALGIVSRLQGLNETLAQQGIGPLEIGVGIHTGAVVAGLIGPDNRIEYGVVGDAVNLASRVEALTREMQATILVSRDISAQLGPSFALGRTATMLVKGKSQPVEVVEVLSLCQPVDSSGPP